MLKRVFKNMKGYSLVEVLIAIALMATTGLGILTALGSASTVLGKADIRESARNLAQAQMEYVQDLEYKTTDPTDNLVFYDKVSNLSTEYPGFDVEVHASRVDKGSGIADDTGIQEITVQVKQGSKVIFTLVGMKVNREIS